LESNLLYKAAQQMNPWRAGTPGRAPRNWRAVVEWRPLRLFIPTIAVLALSQRAAAQSVEVRLGALYATPLIKDAVSSRAVNDSIPGPRSSGIQLQQKIAPVATVALHLPTRGKSDIEVSAAVAHSMLEGDDGMEKWDVAGVTTGNLVVSLGYRSSQLITLHAGVGVTKLFAKQTALFTSGNSIKPLAEFGVSAGKRIANRELHLDARVQTHAFGTATMRDNNLSDGSVLRGIVQVGTTVWQRRRP
jgi:hypothetical protein